MLHRHYKALVTREESEELRALWEQIMVRGACGDCKGVNWWHLTRKYLELYQTASQGKPEMDEVAHGINLEAEGSPMNNPHTQ